MPAMCASLTLLVANQIKCQITKYDILGFNTKPLVRAGKNKINDFLAPVRFCPRLDRSGMNSFLKVFLGNNQFRHCILSGFQPDPVFWNQLDLDLCPELVLQHPRMIL